MSTERTDRETYDILIEQIERAFADVRYPGDDNIIATPEHIAVCEECGDLHKALVGRRRAELLADDESRGHVGHAMSFFSPAGWQYYLPAYLIQSIRFRRLDSLHFLPSDDQVVAEFERERVNRLTVEQCQAVIAYLLAVQQGGHFGIYADEQNQRALDHWRENYRRLVLRNQDAN